MRYNILLGGKAGQGPNILGELLGNALVNQGYYVFYSRDYQSLIRGGHNFNVLTFSDSPVRSNDSGVDILVALDENTKKIHEKDLKKGGILLDGGHDNMYFAGRIFKLLGMDFALLEKQLKELKKRFEENMVEAKKGYEEETKNLCQIKLQKKNLIFSSGSEEVAQGAINSGMDIYYAYPMTPATPILGELAKKQVEKNFVVLELENETAVMNAAIGSSITGAKVMIGTSGGGFDLMSEALSLAGIAEVPIVAYLAQRPGPASGVPTYTSQGDLNMARHGGHGEFERVVLTPGDPRECQEMINQAFYFSQKYKLPVIVLSDKHLAESFYTLIEKSKMIPSPKSMKLGRYNSYEKDSEGSATDDPKIIEQNVIDRAKKVGEIKKEAYKFSRYEIYGKKDSKNVVVSWGSTKGAILDAIGDLDCEFVQIKYIEPFPEEVEKELKGKNIILVENNAAGPLADLIREKTGVLIENKILKFDGRPFLADKLNGEIKGKLK